MKKARTKQGLLSIIKWYAVVFGIVIVSFVSIISIVLAREIYSKEQEAVKQAVLHVEDMYNEDSERSLWMADRLLGDSQKIESAQKYFDLDNVDYYKYYLEHSMTDQGENYYYLPSEVESLYFEDDWLRSISFTFYQSPQVFNSTSENKQGKIEKSFPKNKGQVNFSFPISNESFTDVTANIRFSIDQKKYNTILDQYQNIQPIDMMILSNNTPDKGQVLYASKSKLPSVSKLTDKKYLVARKDFGNYSFIGFVPEKPVQHMILGRLGILWVGTAVIVAFLLIVLYRLLISYQLSVSDILHTLNKVGDGDMDVRIKEEEKDSELLEISKSVNEMLDNINQYIVENYRLENEQKEANLRALQSQINPHFLYNTLEYIRMYAVNVGADELAEVVFAFSRLLRNNISQEKFTTLEKEMEFCEKYAYLYQMRYPDCLAYGFQIAPEVKEQQIPKFIIQPLIENYFIHGVDFSRIDNVGSVKAFQRGNRIIIEVKDNGVGIPKEDLTELQQMETDCSKVETGKNVGIRNIYERLNFYYDGDFKFTFQKNEPTGTVVTINIPLHRREKESV